MELQEIHEELDRIGKMDSIDFYEFQSLFYDYPRVLTLRKDLMEQGFDVVDPILFISKLIDDIPELRSTNHRKWNLYEMQDENFLIVTNFSESLDTYEQKIFLFNQSEELEFLTTIDSPLSFYAESSDYLDSLPVSFENTFINNLESDITQPVILEVFRKHIITLLSRGEHKKALNFLANRSDYINSQNAQKLENRIRNNFNEFNLYCETKSEILQALVYDHFNDARGILKTQFNNLNSDSYEDLEDLIRQNEYAYERVIQLRDQADMDAAQEMVDQIAREKQAAIEDLAHARSRRNLELQDLKSSISSKERLIQLKEVELRQNSAHNEKMEQMRKQELNQSNQSNYYTCRHCQKTVPGRPSNWGCQGDKMGLHLWQRHN